jgi:hypothetical protein
MNILYLTSPITNLGIFLYIDDMYTKVLSYRIRKPILKEQVLNTSNEEGRVVLGRVNESFQPNWVL